MSEADLDESSTDEPVSYSFRQRFWFGLRSNLALYLVLIVLVMCVAAFIVAIQGVQGNREQNIRLTDQIVCQNRYNQINNERTRQLADATTAERTAEDEADDALTNFVAALQERKPQAETARLFKELNQKLLAQQEKRQETEAERLEHPVPPPPEALCGPLPKQPTN